jgi:hypothetical protein
MVDGHSPAGDYAFDKYNKAVEVVRYTDEEYNEHLVDPVSEIMNFVQCTKCQNYLTLDYHCNCKFQSKNTAWSFWEEMFPH